MAVKIKLKRIGKIHAPQYRIVVADARTARNGRAIEEIGIYQPMNDPSIIKVNSERAQYWLGVGAQPTSAVTAILKVTGDWQTFKGLPGTEGTLRVAEPKVAKVLVFEAAVQEAAKEPKTPARKHRSQTSQRPLRPSMWLRPSRWLKPSRLSKPLRSLTQLRLRQLRLTLSPRMSPDARGGPWPSRTRHRR